MLNLDIWLIFNGSADFLFRDAQQGMGGNWGDSFGDALFFIGSWYCSKSIMVAMDDSWCMLVGNYGCDCTYCKHLECHSLCIHGILL